MHDASGNANPKMYKTINLQYTWYWGKESMHTEMKLDMTEIKQDTFHKKKLSIIHHNKINIYS